MIIKPPKFRIPLPWMGVYYDITWDEMRRGRKYLAVTWWREYGVCYFVFGWSYTFQPKDVL